MIKYSMRLLKQITSIDSLFNLQLDLSSTDRMLAYYFLGHQDQEKQRVLLAIHRAQYKNQSMSYYQHLKKVKKIKLEPGKITLFKAIMKTLFSLHILSLTNLNKRVLSRFPCTWYLWIRHMICFQILLKLGKVLLKKS